MSRAGGLRVALIAPPWYEVPPRAYGGVELLCASLISGLQRRGNTVTLIGAGGDHTAAKMISTFRRPPGGLGTSATMIVESLHALRASAALREIDVDIVHDHTALAPIVMGSRDVPTVSTVHSHPAGRLAQLYSESELPVVAVSDEQRSQAVGLPWVATIHNAIDVDSYPFQAQKEGFALFLGRIHPDKGPHLAIEAARQAKMPLLLAGKCSEPLERRYFEETISPMLDDDIRYIGVADQRVKRDLLRRASVLLFPILWEEPFGLVMVEAMACGTPVVATRRGAVPEVLTDGVTGVIVDDPRDLAQAIEATSGIDPRKCRRDAEHRFDIPLLAARYEETYRHILRGDAPTASLPIE
jgi:glycosyltransferase involved in cell wall biosynthesis